jgi:hypothetical protein
MIREYQRDVLKGVIARRPQADVAISQLKEQAIPRA